MMKIASLRSVACHPDRKRGIWWGGGAKTQANLPPRFLATLGMTILRRASLVLLLFVDDILQRVTALEACEVLEKKRHGAIV